MTILIKNFRNIVASATTVVFAICIATGNVYAQQSSDKSKVDKSTSADKNKPLSKSEKRDGEISSKYR